ncbi:MAG: hypothetical protein AAGG48_19685 [Planctomycetota bacterium]
MKLRSQSSDDKGTFKKGLASQDWLPNETAIIVCDVWDYHHCLNAVRRVGEFAPTLDRVLHRARDMGVTIIHAPSGCMETYEEHPARLRAIRTPAASQLPPRIQSWCSIIPAEEKAVYPIDQSDGGEDDDPEEHLAWAKELESMGRNPKTPWKAQSDLITIDSTLDLISDRGDEIWNVLEDRGIKNVILAGVHTNMCVLGRPFGLRQMAQNGKNVVLMRDMTDTMYNPERWPYVSHFEGTRRIIDHIERYVCPTITSNQWIGGEPFRFKGDDGRRESTRVESATAEWSTVAIPHASKSAAQDNTPHWYRCVIRVPKRWSDGKLVLQCKDASSRVWINGKELSVESETKNDKAFLLANAGIEFEEANLLVLQLPMGTLVDPPVIQAGQEKYPLKGRWHRKVGSDPADSNMPLPSKFGASTDIVFTP